MRVSACQHSFYMAFAHIRQLAFECIRAVRFSIWGNSYVTKNNVGLVLNSRSKILFVAVHISLPLKRHSIELENTSFCIKKYFLFESMTKISIKSSLKNFQPWYYNEKFFQNHFEFKHRLFWKLFLIKICKRRFSIFQCDF